MTAYAGAICKTFVVIVDWSLFETGKIFTVLNTIIFLTSEPHHKYCYMTRMLFLSAAIALVTGCGTAKNITSSNSLNGTWIAVAQELGGKPLPPAFYEKQKLILADSTYTLVAESVDKGTVQVDGDRLDITGKEGVNAGKHFKAIYKIEQQQLVICYDLSGQNYPAAYSTKDQPYYFLAHFKKE